MIKYINHGHHNELNYRGRIRETATKSGKPRQNPGNRYDIRETRAKSGKPDPLFPDGIREYSVYKA